MSSLPSLQKASLVSLAVLLGVSILSRLSSSESRGGAYGREQSAHVCMGALRRARFYSEAARQDESLSLALLHACEARANAAAAKDMAERTGVTDPVISQCLVTLEEEQEHIDSIVAEMSSR